MDQMFTAAEHSALLVVDVQRDFCPGGALPVPNGDKVVPALNRHLDRAAAHGVRIYASRDWHPRMTRHFKEYGGEWPPHCVQDTDGARFHPDLRLPPAAVVISKGQDPDSAGYSALEGRTADGRPFADDLREHRIDHLFVGGLATDYCVRSSVIDALRAGFRVTVLQDAVAGIDARPGDSDVALREMQDAGARLLPSSPP